eukprot:CAMPEP_0176190538 /NCGR_PEP_ID=MMETSP0121_2-20121125/3988_1 /TAXON_ID=160619 /ORGANISM="Kryptoperidinium foliaceum, Strain CCMP 1326" /LENGTH=303 /DNA_ID=CAMNT_0017529159 /DNA_START=111 /DNA_END=1022 /DNA_ORIENTATION=-
MWHTGCATFIACASISALVYIQQTCSQGDGSAPQVVPLTETVGRSADNSITVYTARERFRELYALYAGELTDLHGLMRGWCAKRQCLSDDLEIEATYMRVRAFKPHMLWEVSPHQGFTTMVLLSALKKNGFGRLISFDLMDKCRDGIPATLAEDRWTFVEGDFKAMYPKHLNTSRPDYLFLDSFHSYEFGRFYTTELFPAMGGGHLPVSLHDVYNPGFWNDKVTGRSSAYPDWMPNEEGLVVIDWLKDQPHVCGVYTLAKSRTDEQVKLHTDIRAIREGILGAGTGIRGVDGLDPTLYFELNC